MITLNITVDEWTYETLNEMAREHGIEAEDLASRLLRRAIRAARPEPIYDIEALKAYAKEFEAEDLALADPGSAHRLELWEAEDRA